MSEPRDIAAQIKSVAESVERRFQRGRRVLSFAEYLDLFAADPGAYARDASRYVRDCFDPFGTTKVKHPWGEYTRYDLFDLPWEPKPKSQDALHAAPGVLPKGALVGQEHVQDELYRALSNFAREGRPNRLVLLHGPNGSAKSTIVGCIMRALEQYSNTDSGVLYRFNWVFPTTKTTRGSLGFGNREDGAKNVPTYAHLTDDEIDAKLLVEVRDHPLFLIPVEERRVMLERAFKEKDGKSEPPSDWILRGQLSHKSQQVFEALLSSYDGSYAEVLKHVQVERYFISQRYRVGAVTIGPQMSVDAAERQVTADRSLASLPASLQAITLYEAKGELVEAAGGILEFSDLLKRPLDAFKYLQLSVETGEVNLTMQNVQLNCVMMGSANELHLDAFKDHPEFASFRGRLDLVRTPYLRSYVQEQSIYDSHVAPQIRRHVAPHATKMAAMFAVLTRMRKPNAEKHTRSMAAAVSGLTALEKMDLYALGIAPERLEADAQKLLHANVDQVYAESDSYPIYEGRVGASPREMRVVILDAAQSTAYRCLNPLAVLDEIDVLCQQRAEFEWLQQDPIAGGFHDVKQFREALAGRLSAAWEQELYASSGLIDDERYAELFDRYVQNVSVWTKKERIRNKLTGEYEEPDEKLMREVERLLDVKTDAPEWRKAMISNIAAWALDNPSGGKIDTAVVFPQYLRRMRESIFADKRGQIAKIARDIVVLVREEGSGLDHDRRKEAQETIDRMIARFGYCPNCAADAASVLLRKRFADLNV